MYMWIRIHQPKLMRIHGNADPKQWRFPYHFLYFFCLYLIRYLSSVLLLGQEKRCSGQNNPCWQKTNRKVLLNFVPSGSQESFCFVFRKHFIVVDHAVLFFYVQYIVYQLFTCLHCITLCSTLTVSTS